MSSFLDRFDPDPEFPDDRWMWETDKPVLRHGVVKFAPFDPDFHKAKLPKKPYPLEPSCASARLASDQVAVVLFERDETAAQLQQNAWDYLVANSALVETSLLRKLTAIQKRDVQQLFEEEMPGNPAFEKHWKEMTADMESPEDDLSSFYKLVGISIAPTGLDECAIIGFEFQTGWDQDHGLGIAMHKDRVLAAGGMTELLSPYGSIVDGIKGTQAYEVDPGDFVLP